MSRKKYIFIVVGIILITGSVAVLYLLKINGSQNSSDNDGSNSVVDEEAKQIVHDITEAHKTRAEETDDQRAKINHIVNYAQLLSNQGNTEKALEELLNIEQASEEDVIRSTDLYFQISGMYDMLDRPDEASDYREKYIRLLRDTSRDDLADYLENPPEDT